MNFFFWGGGGCIAIALKLFVHLVTFIQRLLFVRVVLRAACQCSLVLAGATWDFSCFFTENSCLTPLNT